MKVEVTAVETVTSVYAVEVGDTDDPIAACQAALSKLLASEKDLSPAEEGRVLNRSYVPHLLAGNLAEPILESEFI